jgi:hypothetical protein
MREREITLGQESNNEKKGIKVLNYGLVSYNGGRYRSVKLSVVVLNSDV